MSKKNNPATSYLDISKENIRITDEQKQKAKLYVVSRHADGSLPKKDAKQILQMLGLAPDDDTAA